jgi:hypothetical protein
MKTALPLTLLALVATASAQIDSGGGRSVVGTMTNHASIGWGVSVVSPQGPATMPNLPYTGHCPTDLMVRAESIVLAHSGQP